MKKIGLTGWILISMGAGVACGTDDPLLGQSRLDPALRQERCLS